MSDRRRLPDRLRILAAAAAILWGGILPVMASMLIADPGGPDQEMYNQGRSLIFEEQWGQAREIFETLQRRHPGSPFIDDALYWIAFSLFEESKPEPAYQTLHNLIRKYPDSPWNDDARALMVRCAEAALKEQASSQAGRPGRAETASEYRRFIEESTHDRSAQVSLIAIDTLLSQEPRKAPDLIGRVGSSPSALEGAVVVLDRYFGKEKVKVSFDEPRAGFAEGNVHVLVREGDQALRLSLTEALDAIRGRGSRALSDTVRIEMSERILEAERSLVTQGEIKADPGQKPGKGRVATIVRVVDGEVHYYTNGAETIRVMVLRRSAGFASENVQVYVEGSGGIRQIPLADLMSPSPETNVRGLSTDGLRYLTQTLGVIQLDLGRTTR